MTLPPLTPESLARSVVAVPPLARRRDLSLNFEENHRLVRHLRAGGVTTLLYGGNANLYNIGLDDYTGLLEWLSELAREEMLVIPSAGPSFGQALDQARILSRFKFPATMILPLSFPSAASGVEVGVRRFVELSGRPAILYIKQEDYIGPDHVERLMTEGHVAAVKYAVVRQDPGHDPFLRTLVERVDPQRIISGIGEQPALVHLRDFRLGGFTSGCVCVAPAPSTRMLQAMQGGRWQEAEEIRSRFRPLEELRNTHGPIAVLHQAVALAGIAETGPLLPWMTNLDHDLWPRVQEASLRLKADHDEALARLEV